MSPFQRSSNGMFQLKNGGNRQLEDFPRKGLGFREKCTFQRSSNGVFQPPIPLRGSPLSGAWEPPTGHTPAGLFSLLIEERRNG
jgi:hypothetical protein